MTIGITDAETAVLNMLQRYEALTMEDLMVGRSEFSWSQWFLAIDRLSRKNRIALRRMGQNYQLRLVRQEQPVVQDRSYEERLVLH